jgi:hypothetical protein
MVGGGRLILRGGGY